MSKILYKEELMENEEKAVCVVKDMSNNENTIEDERARDLLLSKLYLNESSDIPIAIVFDQFLCL
ncbi:MAG: hypothetical protein N3B21_09005 [Clostridia bacterium]|nr:hypothetical protein [Clostridia bacterium]